MGSVAILCKLRNGNAYSGMQHCDVPQQTMLSKGGSSELRKGDGKGKFRTPLEVRGTRSWPQRKGSGKGDPLAQKKQCQCLCETSREGAASRCKHKPRRRHVCSECQTLVCTRFCWIEQRQMCHLCWEDQLFLHLCYSCAAIARADVAANAFSLTPDEFQEERRHTFQWTQMRHDAVKASGAGDWCQGLDDFGFSRCRGCERLTEEKLSSLIS